MAAVGIAGLAAAGPGTDEPARSWRESIIRNFESAGLLAIGAGPRPRAIEAIRLQSAKVFRIIKIQIEHRAVMLSGSDDDRRFAAKEKIMRVLRMKTERRRSCQNRAGEPAH